MIFQRDISENNHDWWSLKWIIDYLVEHKNVLCIYDFKKQATTFEDLQNATFKTAVSNENKRSMKIRWKHGFFSATEPRFKVISVFLETSAISRDVRIKRTKAVSHNYSAKLIIINSITSKTILFSIAFCNVYEKEELRVNKTEKTPRKKPQSFKCINFLILPILQYLLPILSLVAFSAFIADFLQYFSLLAAWKCSYILTPFANVAFPSLNIYTIISFVDQLTSIYILGAPITNQSM